MTMEQDINRGANEGKGMKLKCGGCGHPYGMHLTEAGGCWAAVGTTARGEAVLCPCQEFVARARRGVC